MSLRFLDIKNVQKCKVSEKGIEITLPNNKIIWGRF